MAIRVIPAQGEPFAPLVDKEPTLEQLQNWVGGYIEVMTLGDTQLVFDEEGIWKRLPINHNASNVAGRTLVGNVVVLTKEHLMT